MVTDASVTSVDLNSLQATLLSYVADINAEFYNFVTRTEELLDKVESIVIKKFNPDPVELEEILDECISFFYTVGQYVANANSFITLYNVIHYQPKQQKLSESDRKIQLDMKTVTQRHVLEMLRQAEDKLDKKISVGQSILKYETARLIKEKQ